MPIDVPPAPFHQLAPTPPMGWNSWDCFGTAVTEAQTKANADYMAEKLRRVGYEYVVVDIQWYQPTATRGHEYEPGAKLVVDANGRLLPATNKFPSAANGAGFKALADYVHGKGLKFGIHLMRGIPRQAVEQNLPILGTELHARDVANTGDTCKWNPDMFGVDMTKPGGQAYYDSVFKLVASWGVDFVKVDDLSRPYGDHVPEIEAIRKAIDASGRPMVLSTSPGETPVDFGQHVATHANMWRTSDDFWDNWKLLTDQFERANKWSSFTGPGHWPDHDMLPVGAVRVGQKDPWTKFTKDEQFTMLSLWAMARSPLMIGGDLPQNDDFTLSLLTNEDVTAINQHSVNGRQVFRENGHVAWVADEPKSGDKYVALFNLNDVPKADAAKQTITLKLADIGIAGRVAVKELWTKRDFGIADGAIAAPVNYHGCALFRLTPVK